MLRHIEGLNYLAAPYSHTDPWVREERYKQALRATVKLLRGGHVVFSPLVHTHETGKSLSKAVDHDFWINQDIPILKASQRLLVLLLDGWKHSKGVAAEVSIAVKNNIDVVYVMPEDL